MSADDKSRPEAEDGEVDYATYGGLKEFMGETTMHGVQYVFRGSILLRLLWLAGVSGALGGFLYFFITAVDNYLVYPSTTKIDIVTVQELPTPAVTICNANFAQRSSLAPGRPDANSSRAFVCSFYDFQNDPGRECPLSSEEAYNLVWARGRSARDVLLQLGQPASDLILDGLVADITRNLTIRSSQLSSVVTAQGICHTFNADGSREPILNTGVDAGVQFLVNVDQNQYAGVSLLSAGVEVYIHPPGEGILRGRNAVYVGPGQRANIALSPQRREILDSPYRKQGCVSSNINRDKSKPYSAKQCLLECQEYFVADRCGCLAVSVPKGVAIPLESGDVITDHCTAFQYLTCSLSTGLQVQVNRTYSSVCSSRCRQPCTPASYQYVYRYTMSWDLFPSTLVAEEFITTLVRIGKYMNILGAPDNLTYVRNNFAQINVYYDELAYESIVEQPAVTLASLFGSVGGNLGLFLGASMLTLLEFGQYFVRFLKTRLAKRSGYDKKRSDGDRPTAMDEL